MKFTLPPQRRFMSLAYDGHGMWIAVADDGTVWRRRYLTDCPVDPWKLMFDIQPLPVPEDNTR